MSTVQIADDHGIFAEMPIALAERDVARGFLARTTRPDLFRLVQPVIDATARQMLLDAAARKRERQLRRREARR